MKENQTRLGARCAGPWCDSGITTHQAEAAEEIRFGNESLHNLLRSSESQLSENRRTVQRMHTNSVFKGIEAACRLLMVN